MTLSNTNPAEGAGKRIGNLSQAKQALLRKLAAKKAQQTSAEVSDGQVSLWLIDQMSPGDGVYNVPLGLRLQGPLDLGHLQAAINDVVARHEALRTSFTSVSGQPRPVVAEALHVPLRVIEAVDEDQLKNVAAEEATKGFDLSAVPLMRAAVARLGNEDHALLLTFHHTIFDGHSLGVFLQELSAFYRARSGDSPANLPPVTPYSSFVAWQKQFAASVDGQQAMEHFKRLLAAPRPALDLPMDKSRSQAQSFNGASVSLDLPGKLVEKLDQFSRNEGVTPFMLMLAAYAVVLHRYSNVDDLLIGSAASNRGRREFERTIGLLANNLVLRIDAGGQPPFRQFVSRVRQAALDAYAHQAIPFEQILRAVGGGREPLFRAYFNYIEEGSYTLDLPGVRCQTTEMREHRAKHDLTLFYIRGQRHCLLLNFNGDVLDGSTVQRMLNSLCVVLDAVVDHADEALCRLPVMDEDGRRRILESFNATAAAYPNDRCAHELIAEQAAHRRGAVAVRFEDQALTYQELLARSERLARRLRAAGVTLGDRVGILMNRGLDLPVALLATMRAGAAYVPIDPAYPPVRVNFMMQDSGMSALLTESSLASTIGQPPCRVVIVEEIDDAVDLSPLPQVKTSSPAYVIYTSGSTGRPKGVVVPHQALVNFLCSMRREPGFEENDVLLAVTTVCFDISGLELFLPLASGGQVVIASAEVAADGHALSELLDRSGATVMQATPSTWKLLLGAGWTGSPKLKILCGGEALPRELAEGLLPGSASLWNMYGPTETTIWSTIHRVSAGEGIIAVGRPIANTQVYVLDGQMQPVPIGVAGEIYIGGDGVADGYLNRPELTADRFVKNLFSASGAARTYRTGDLGRWRADATLECLGRGDQQVKLRGHRIELGEVEYHLAADPSVREAAVAVRQDSSGEAALVAYLVASNGNAPSAAEIRARLGRSLPHYMLPSKFVWLERLPLTPNGKLDRKALPEPRVERASFAGDYVEPRNALERVVAGIWRDVLKLPQIGVDDNFFTIGGHSLLGAQVVARLRDVLRTDVPLKMFLTKPTIAELGAALCQDPQHARRVELAAELLEKIDQMSSSQVDSMLHPQQAADAVRSGEVQ